MTLPGAPGRLFGVPTRQRRPDAERLLVELCSAWDAQYAGLGRLEDDLKKMYERMFKAIAREETVRNGIEYGLQAGGGTALPADLCVQIGAGQVVAPEGRVLIELLEPALAEQHGDWIEFADGDIRDAEHLLLDVYRTWGRERVRKVVRMLAGEGGPLLPAPTGMAIVLLLVDATGLERGITRNPPGRESEDERAVVAAVAAFAATLDTAKVPEGIHLALYGGYAISEARRRMPQIRLEAPSRSKPKRVFVQEGQRETVAGFLVEEFRRRQRPLELVRQAIDAMFSELRTSSPDGLAARAARGLSDVRKLLELPDGDVHGDGA